MHNNEMPKISKKGARTIKFALDRFYGRKSLSLAKSLEDFKIPNALQRELRLKDHRILLMTDVGIEHLQNIVKTLHEDKSFSDLANYSDIWQACHSTLQELLSDNLQPETGEEFIELVNERLAKKVDIRTFAAPLFGIELIGIPALELGSMRIEPAISSYLDAIKIDHSHSNIDKIVEITGAKFWLIGSAKGTPSVAEEKFRTQAELMVGMLAISAASMYEKGATAFRIGIVMSPAQAYGRAAWVSWAAKESATTTHYNFVSSQALEVTSDLVQKLDEIQVFNRALKLLHSDIKSPLEESITRAVYWYSDAHRESIPVMKLIKYWSCVETFFSYENTDITHSVSVGMACVLIFGHFRFIEPSAYSATKKRVANLYALRSKAVHGGSHAHVSEIDAADLSQWVAWLILNMISFSEAGYTRLEQIKENCERLDRLETSTDSIA